ncbi:MAG TPA: RDD family protein [Gemmatimonadales bacterium]|jgi:uncharacterized RDD family membrane protein YckC
MEQRIGFATRLGALLLDFVLCGVIAFVGGGTIGGWLGAYTGAAAVAATSAAANAGQDAQAAAAIGGMLGGIFGFALAFALICAVYFLIEGFTGYTLGKLILGVRIANDDGTAAGVGKLLSRYLVKNSNSVLALLALFTGIHVLSTLGGLAGLIIFVGCFFTLGVRRQAIHDMIARTAVYPKAAIK